MKKRRKVLEGHAVSGRAVPGTGGRPRREWKGGARDRSQCASHETLDLDITAS